jgi:hypothetical protein
MMEDEREVLLSTCDDYKDERLWGARSIDEEMMV